MDKCSQDWVGVRLNWTVWVWVRFRDYNCGENSTICGLSSISATIGKQMEGITPFCLTLNITFGDTQWLVSGNKNDPTPSNIYFGLSWQQDRVKTAVRTIQFIYHPSTQIIMDLTNAAIRFNLQKLNSVILRTIVFARVTNATFHIFMSLRKAHFQVWGVCILERGR